MQEEQILQQAGRGEEEATRRAEKEVGWRRPQGKEEEEGGGRCALTCNLLWVIVRVVMRHAIAHLQHRRVNQ